MKTLHTFPLTWSAALVSVLALTLSACGDAGKDAEAQKPAAAASAASAAAAQDPMVVNVPAGEMVRLRFVQALPGLRMYHCHILEHEDQGMMAQIDFLPR